MGKWRRFVKHLNSRFYDALRRRKPRSIGDERIAALIYQTLH
jgi:hypothetical protein